MTYALLPHAGDFSAETVVQPAYLLNVPVADAKGAANLPPFAAVGAPNVIVEAVKPAEDDSGAVVLRLYECEGSKTRTDLTLSAPIKKAQLTNLLEDVQGELPADGGKLTLFFRPFEIKTIKLFR